MHNCRYFEVFYLIVFSKENRFLAGLSLKKIVHQETVVGPQGLFTSRALVVQLPKVALKPKHKSPRQREMFCNNDIFHRLNPQVWENIHFLVGKRCRSLSKRVVVIWQEAHHANFLGLAPENISRKFPIWLSSSFVDCRKFHSFVLWPRHQHGYFLPDRQEERRRRRRRLLREAISISTSIFRGLRLRFFCVLPGRDSRTTDFFSQEENFCFFCDAMWCMVKQKFWSAWLQKHVRGMSPPIF